MKALSGMAMLVCAMAAVAVICVIIFVATGFSYVNEEITLKEAIRTKSDGNEIVLDTMWKVIKQKAQITEKAVTDIKDLNSVYGDLVEGRSGGSLFKMVTENYPDLGKKEVADLYREIMASVEAERATFKRDQLALRDVVGKRRTMTQQQPGRFFIQLFGGDTKQFYKRGDEGTAVNYPLEYQYTWVSSKATKSMVASGEEEIGTGPGLFDE